jgi:hypothetical protein
MIINEHKKPNFSTRERPLERLQQPGHGIQLARGVHGPDEDPRLLRRHLPQPEEALGPAGEVVSRAGCVGVVMPEASTPTRGREYLLVVVRGLAGARVCQEVFEARIKTMYQPVRG